MTTMRKTRDDISAFATFVAEREGKEPGWLTELRRAAITRFDATGIPTPKHEDWKWTSLAPLAALALEHRAGSVDEPGIDTSHVDAFGYGLDAVRVVLVDGTYVPALSGEAVPGLQIDSIVDAADASERVRATLARIAPFEDRAFLALNTAFMGDGAVLRISEGARVERPVHVISITTGAGTMTHPRILLMAEPGSRASIVESHGSTQSNAYASTPITEVACAAGAEVSHLRIQRHPEGAVHLGTLAVRQEARSRLSSTAVDLGARLARNELHVTLAGEHGYCDVGAFYVGREDQVIDNHSRFEHAMPHCESHQLFKGILDDRSRGIFDGKIHVHVDAQKTDAKQTSRNLLLSDGAISNNKPQLEIYADDVKCTHGATTGQLDPDQIFYLRARGLDSDAARTLLTYAFAREVIERIGLEPVKSFVDREVLQRLPMGDLVGEAL